MTVLPTFDASLSDKQRRTVAHHADELLKDLDKNVVPSLHRHVLEAALARLVGSSAPASTDEVVSTTVATPTSPPSADVSPANDLLASIPAAPSVDPDLVWMLSAGVLTAGEELRGPNDAADERAVVTAAGSVVRQGTTHPGPSAAATAAVGYQRNGWLFWHVVKDGTPTSLAVLRSRLRGRSQLRRR